MTVRTAFILAITVGSLTASPAPASAQHRIKDTTTLSVSLGANEVTDKTAKQVYPLQAGGNVFVVRRDVKTTLVVDDTNPLLWEYSATTVTETSPDYSAAVSFAGVLEKLLGAFPGSGGAGIIQPTVDGLAPVTLRDDLVKLAQEIDAIPARLRESIGGPDGVKALKGHFDSDVRGLPDRIDAQYGAMVVVARKCLGGGAGELTVNGHVPIDCDGPYLLQLAVDRADTRGAMQAAADHVQARIAETARALTRVEAAKSAVAMWKARTSLNTSQQSARDVAQRDLTAAEAAHAAATTAQQAAEGALAATQDAHRAAVEAFEAEQRGGRTLRQFLTLAMSMDARIQKQVQILRDLFGDVDGVGKDYVAATHEYSVKEVRTTTIKVEARKKWQPFMPNDVKAAQASGVRTVAITTDAYRPARIAPGAAFVLGFVKNPTFKAVKDGDTYKIVQTEEELTRYNVAAMLNITPDGWQEPTFGGFFQVGVSPKKDEFGFYFGAGIQSHSVFTFGAGFMMQQVRKLGPGLTGESRLASPDELKTAATFKPGLYLHATVTLPQKK